MFLSISIEKTETGYVPGLVFENPKVITRFAVGDPCSTWKEAWNVAKLVRRNRNQKTMEVQVNAEETH